MLITLEGHCLFDDALCAKSVVVDLGANKGRFAHAIVGRFGCRCVAVEPVPELCAMIAPRPGLTVVNAAIANFDGTIDLNVSSHPEASTIKRAPAAGQLLRTSRVPAVRLDHLIAAHGIDRIDVLKVDIEGSEVEVFQSLDDSLLKRIGQINCEFHDSFGMVSSQDVDKTEHRLQALGFGRIQFFPQNRQDMLYVNRRQGGVSHVGFLWGKYFTRNYMGWKRLRQRLRRRTAAQA
jgi:FkbM family methyltransferase